MKKLMFVAFTLAIATAPLWAHCEIPCGIYGDEAKFAEMKQDAQTVEKGINQILELSKDPSANANQIVRWVNNKDEHANKIKEAVAFYFLSQRIKAPESTDKKDVETYHQNLVQLHEITVAAMKTKQTTDVEWAKKLTNAIDAFEKSYMKEHEKKR